MKILVVGDGGREHALAWKLAASPSAEKVFVAPGNAGIAREPGIENVDISAHGDLLEFALAEGVEFTVVGPEAPLAEGIADLFRERGAKIVGPSKAAAMLETSKSFAKQFMSRMDIRTARFGIFEEPEIAKEFIGLLSAPYVVKADGLAAGKGVSICRTHEEVCASVDAMLQGKFGEASMRILVEEHLVGEELSFFVLSDGENVVQLGSGRDYKRLYDGGEGPNTGGMGAVSPAPCLTPDLETRIMEKVVEPTIEGMRREGNPYAGFLYFGLMVCDGEPYLLEYNCRFGDPECQVILPRLQCDFAELLLWAASAKGDPAPKVAWDSSCSAGVVLATQGYATDHVAPGLIRGAGKGLVFHAKTRLPDSGEKDAFFHKGGRALCAVGIGANPESARNDAYGIVDSVDFPGGHYRKDIGLAATA